jgi:hypothetical protein
MVDANPGDGNAETLRRYWQTGPGAIKIRWNTPGDWTRCVANLTKYMGAEDAKGYCNLMHKRMTGMYPGDSRNK